LVSGRYFNAQKNEIAQIPVYRQKNAGDGPKQLFGNSLEERKGESVGLVGVGETEKSIRESPKENRSSTHRSAALAAKIGIDDQRRLGLEPKQLVDLPRIKPTEII
jgi:hypothetical protein